MMDNPEALYLVVDTTLDSGINGINISFSTAAFGNVDWGDGNRQTFSGSGYISHAYLEDGVYTIKIEVLGEPLFRPPTATVYGADNVVAAQLSTKFPTKLNYLNNLKTVNTPGILDWPIDDLSELFVGCAALEAAPALEFTTPPKNLRFMFASCRSLADISGLSRLDTSAATGMGSMFYYCLSLTDISDLAGWNTSAVTDMSGVFTYCEGLTSLDGLKNWNTSAVTAMRDMFSSCATLSNLDGIKDWSTGSVTTMHNMFRDCRALTDVSPLARWSTDAVEDMAGMFRDCRNLTTGNLDRWCVTNITTKPLDFDYGATNWTGARPVWGTCPPPLPSYYGPNIIENPVCKNRLEEWSPNSLGASEPNALSATDPNALVAPEPNVLNATGPNILVAPEPNSLTAPEPNALAAAEPNLLVPQGFAVLR